MKKVFWFSLVAMGFISGCAGNGYGSSKNGKLEHWTVFDGKTIPEMKMGDKQSRVVFMREEGAVNGPAVNVFVDGDYLASLLGGGYRAAVVCSHGDLVLPSFSRNNRFADRDTGVDYNFVTGETAYVKVVSDAVGQPIFQRVSVQEGEEMLSSLKQETQTLPRVKDNRLCDKAVLEKFTLQAHSLFKFDKSDYRNMLPKGREEINALGEVFKKGQAQITSVKVVGYTDPMGSRAYNLALSDRRAQTVKKALQVAGVQANIETEGLGEANLLVRNCLEKNRHNRTQRMRCDQPNRRVEIIVYGNEKK